MPPTFARAATAPRARNVARCPRARLPAGGIACAARRRPRGAHQPGSACRPARWGTSPRPSPPPPPTTLSRARRAAAAPARRPRRQRAPALQARRRARLSRARRAGRLPLLRSRPSRHHRAATRQHAAAPPHLLRDTPRLKRGAGRSRAPRAPRQVPRWLLQAEQASCPYHTDQRRRHGASTKLRGGVPLLRSPGWKRPDRDTGPPTARQVQHSRRRRRPARRSRT
mmetsp:Transcript_29853/g.92134  ORF Transcript_29853/g.92134 Transcript_29853/m.92134 type:complete len:226 (+) Transcript_29853:442-1119(+)